MRASFLNLGKQIVAMAKANGPGGRSVFSFNWKGLEFKVLVTTEDSRFVPTKLVPPFEIQPTGTIDRIKAYRNKHGCSLKEAADVVREGKDQ